MVRRFLPHDKQATAEQPQISIAGKTIILFPARRWSGNAVHVPAKHLKWPSCTIKGGIQSYSSLIMMHQKNDASDKSTVNRLEEIFPNVHTSMVPPETLQVHLMRSCQLGSQRTFLRMCHKLQNISSQNWYHKLHHVFKEFKIWNARKLYSKFDWWYCLVYLLFSSSIIMKIAWLGMASKRRWPIAKHSTTLHSSKNALLFYVLQITLQLPEVLISSFPKNAILAFNEKLWRCQSGCNKM